MPWYIYSIATALCFTGMILCTRHLGNKGFSAKQILTFLLGFAFFGFLFFNTGAVSLASRSENLPVFLVVIIISAVFSVIGNLASFTATIKAPNPGFAGAIQSSNVLLVTLLSVLFFNSSLSLLKFLGAAIVIIGVIVLLVDKRKTIDSAVVAVANKSFFNWKTLAIIAAVAFSLLILGQKQALRLGFSSLQINLFLFGFNFVAFALLSRRELRNLFADKIKMRTLITFAFLAGIFSLMANYLSVIGIGLAPNPGYHESIKYTQNLFIVLLAVPLFHANFNRQKMLGVIIVLVGAVLVVM